MVAALVLFDELVAGGAEPEVLRARPLVEGHRRGQRVDRTRTPGIGDDTTVSKTAAEGQGEAAVLAFLEIFGVGAAFAERLVVLLTALTNAPSHTREPQPIRRGRQKVGEVPRSRR